MPESPNKSAHPTATWALFLTAHTVLLDQMGQRLRAAGLPPLEWYDVLWALERAPEHRLRMYALAERVVLTRANLTRLVDRLEAANLVLRHPTEEDRRGSYAVLTPEGGALRARMWPLYCQAIEELFSRHLGHEEEALGTVLRRILASAG